MECDVDKCSTEANVGDCVSINKTFNATIPVSLKALIAVEKFRMHRIIQKVARIVRSSHWFAF